MTKYEYMQLALELARKGLGHTSPNPMVGCVVVKNGNIVAQGFHDRYGGYHAERNALMNCGEEVAGADLYVTLEPCCHQGKTPPCTDIIIERGIGRVFIGAMDPNPKVAGKGAEILRRHGIEVETGILEKECMELNEVFMHYIVSKTPYIAMKYAMTMDGKIATFTGDSKWVTGEEAREHVHQLRKRYSSIMVGIGTVLVDDPMLNCRVEEGVDPVRVICDSHLRIPLASQIVATAGDIRTIVAYASGDEETKERLSEAGVELLRVDAGGTVDFTTLVRELGKMGIDSILVEGGGTFHGTVLKSGLVNRIYCYIAPKLIGGKDARSPVEGSGFPRMKEALEIRDTELLKLGGDICITGSVNRQGEETIRKLQGGL